MSVLLAGKFRIRQISPFVMQQRWINGPQHPVIRFDDRLGIAGQHRDQIARQNMRTLRQECSLLKVMGEKVAQGRTVVCDDQMEKGTA